MTALGLNAGLMLMLGSRLPDQVATHFGVAGAADSWMPRSGAISFFILFPCIMSLFIVAAVGRIKYLPPTGLRVPNAVYWRSPEHYPEACRKVEAWSINFGVLLVAFMAAIFVLSIDANQSVPPGLNMGMLLAVVVAFLLLVNLSVFKLIRAYRI